MAETRRRGPLVALAACAAVVLVVVGLVVIRQGTATTVDVGGTETSAPDPPAEPDRPFTLWLSATRVPPGAEVVAVLVNHEGTTATFGVGASLERWDGAAWVRHGQLSMCLDHWSCTAPVEPADDRLTVPGIGLTATPEAAGPPERFSTDGLSVGWYRLSQTASPDVVAAGVFEIADAAAAPAPLWPTDVPAISVQPALIDPAGAVVRLSPLVPGASSATEHDAAVAGLSEAATIERWDGGGWAEVVAVELGSVPVDSRMRTAALPPLAPGSYRIVRSGPSEPWVGSFWVAPAVATPPVDQPLLELHPWRAGEGERAAFGGVLTIAADGCSAIGGKRAAWPAGTVIIDGGAGLRLTDGRVYLAGRELELGGGEHRSDELADPQRCGGGDVWFVT